MGVLQLATSQDVGERPSVRVVGRQAQTRITAELEEACSIANF